MPSNVHTLPVTTPEDRRQAETEARVRLMRARRALGLSQLDLSLKLSISVDSVEDYESGRTKVPGWVLVRAEQLVALARREAA